VTKPPESEQPTTVPRSKDFASPLASFFSSTQFAQMPAPPTRNFMNVQSRQFQRQQFNEYQSFLRQQQSELHQFEFELEIQFQLQQVQDQMRAFAGSHP
jgi:hypothetical protein